MSSVRGAAFVGAGFISYMHNYALRVCGAKLVAIASNSRRVAEHRAHIFDAEPYTFAEVERMLGRPDVDMVFILSPNAFHARHALAALHAGKHVVLEKPMALTLSDAREMIGLAEKQRLQIGYAENQVFSPVVRRARELVAEGVVGKVRRVVAFVGHSGPAPEGWFWSPALAGGGAQFDLGSHTVEAALYLAGQPSVRAVTRARLIEHASGVDCRAQAVIACADDIELDLTTSYVEPDESMWYEVHGHRGMLRCVFSPAPRAADHPHREWRRPAGHRLSASFRDAARGPLHRQHGVCGSVGAFPRLLRTRPPAGRVRYGRRTRARRLVGHLPRRWPPASGGALGGAGRRGTDGSLDGLPALTTASKSNRRSVLITKPRRGATRGSSDDTEHQRPMCRRGPFNG